VILNTYAHLVITWCEAALLYHHAPKRPETESGSLIGNVLWFIFAGLWLALGHLVSALLFAITIIGIPFAIASLRLAEAALFPFGREVVPLAEGRSRST
jgi:uncharacterized membrane protein YccF (DUF307 family)